MLRTSVLLKPTKAGITLKGRVAAALAPEPNVTWGQAVTRMRNVAARNAMGPTKRRRQPRTFAILPAGPDVPAARFAVLLAEALGRIGSQVQMLGSDSADQEPDWFARCEAESSFVLYRADPTSTEWTELCLRQADCLVVVRLADNDRPTKVPFEIESTQSGAVFHRRRELVPVVVTLHWTCKQNPDERLMDPGKCLDGAIRQLVLWSPHAPPGMWLGEPYCSDDGLHPNAAGNELLATRVADALERLFGPQIRRQAMKQER